MAILWNIYGSTSYVKNDNVIDELINEMNERKADLLPFNYYHHPKNNIELGVIFCHLDSEFIKRVCDIYVYGLNTGRRDLMKKMMRKGLIINATHHYSINNVTGKPHCHYYFFSYYCV